MNNRKSFLYYSRLSVSEGLDTETNELQMNLEHFDKDIFNKCTYCHQVFAIKKNFEKDEKACNACVKLLEKEVKISPKIYIFWKNKANYRVFTDLHRNYPENIFLREPIIGKDGKSSSEKLDIQLNRLLNYD